MQANKKSVQPFFLCVAFLGGGLAFGGCASSPSSQTPVVFHLDTPENVSLTMSFVDRRDPEEKTYRGPSFHKSGHRLGDENFSPDRLKVLALRFQGKVGSSYSGRNIEVEKFEVTIFRPPPPSRPEGPFIGPYTMTGVIGNLLGETIVELLSGDKRETLIVMCEIQGSASGRSFKGWSDRVVPDPKADLFNTVRAVVREAIDNAAGNLLQ